MPPSTRSRTLTPSSPWPGDTIVTACDQTRPPKSRAEIADPAASPLPSWAGTPGNWTPAPPPPEPALPSPLAPSRPGEIAFGPVPRIDSPRLAIGKRDAFRRGTLVHTLLQHLPSLPEPDWDAAAATFLARHPLDPAEAAAMLAQTLAVLRDPALAPLFAPGSRAEQPLTGLVGTTIITGTVDRLAVLPGRVLLVDYKTGREAPKTVADTPVLYLRQLAAYRAVLRGIYPRPRDRVRPGLDRRSGHHPAPVRPARCACATCLIEPIGRSI